MIVMYKSGTKLMNDRGVTFTVKDASLYETKTNVLTNPKIYTKVIYEGTLEFGKTKERSFKSHTELLSDGWVRI